MLVDIILLIQPGAERYQARLLVEREALKSFTLYAFGRDIWL
jgi:hypothetical protein